MICKLCQLLILQGERFISTQVLQDAVHHGGKAQRQNSCILSDGSSHLGREARKKAPGVKENHPISRDIHTPAKSHFLKGLQVLPNCPKSCPKGPTVLPNFPKSIYTGMARKIESKPKTLQAKYQHLQHYIQHLVLLMESPGLQQLRKLCPSRSDKYSPHGLFVTLVLSVPACLSLAEMT